MAKKLSSSSQGRRSKDKGKRGEREFAKFLRDHFGIDAKRGVQFQGGTDSPDVTLGSLSEHLHVEVKRTEKLALWQAIDQAVGDSKPSQVPMVAHRPSGKPWLVILKAQDLERFAKAFYQREKLREKTTDDDHGHFHF